jgi:ABC-type oligopeptide transport system substrate-binding subunit/class 3 adenylate cyclase
MECPQCGTENPEGARFCLRCATRLFLVCAECGAQLPPHARFCVACAAPVAAIAAPLAKEPRSEGLVERLRRLVPKEYAERLLSTRGQVSPERRTVTILFSDVKGSTAMAENLDPEEVLEIMNGAFEVLIEPVYRHEGTLARLMGDAVLAFFGAPLAHEDDPERALRAALEILAGAQQYAERLEQERGLSGFNVRVGVHTGLVVVGEVGTDLRVEYTAMGDAVNLAARMEQAAPPGGLLISHDTYRLVRGVFDVLAQPPLLVKGRSEPVQTYLVQRAKERAFRKPPRGVEGVETRMVGREAELKHLQEAFHAIIEDGELQVVTVSGDAGVGKSRLLYEFDLWAELVPQPFYYFKGRAGQEMLNQPYGLLRDLVSFRFQIPDSDPPAVVRDKLEEGVAEGLGPPSGWGAGAAEESRRSAHLVGHLLGFALGDSPHLAGLVEDAQQLRDEALAALAGYFRGLAGQAAVLVLLEDLHWADDSSLDALNHLALALASQPVLIVAAARPALFERRPHWGEGQPFHSRLALGPLSRWDSRRLVDEVLQKVDQVPAGLRELLVGGAEGNPFFLEELVRMLVEDGVVVTGEEEWRLAPERLAEIRVPPTLTGVLQARLDRLPPEERAVLQQASVVGRLFWDRAVARLHAPPGEGDKAGGEDQAAGVGGHLTALRGREMIYQRETSAFAGAQEYIFQHTLLREITYEGVLKRLRRAYHGLVADWLLEEAGERAGEYVGLIAEHLALAGRSEEAVEYLLQAGDRARGLYAQQEAIRAYERALALLKERGDDDRAARTLMKLGLTYHTAFDYRRARQAHEEGFALWQKAGQARPGGPLPPAPHALRLHWVDPPTLDPGLAGDSASAVIIEQLFSGLVSYTPELSIVPDVAARWEVFDDGRRYLFHLRPDVRWSDGVPVTAGDFEYAWRRLLDPVSASPLAGNAYVIKGAQAFHEGQSRDLGVRALDNATLEVELQGPTGYFLHLLACVGAYPVPRHVVEARGTSWADGNGLVGNGPFTVASWQPGESLVLERNPHDHERAGGNVHRVELKLIYGHETAIRLETYQAALSDVLELIGGPKHLDPVRKSYAAEYVSLPEAATHSLVFDVARPPFDDPRVRQAFALALDRETLVHVVWGGYFLPPTGGFVPPGMPGYAPGIALPYDPEQARALLAEAGYPGGAGFAAVEMLTHVPEREYWDPLVEQWADNLGVAICWDSVAWGAYLERVRQARPHIYFMGWVGDYPDPDNYLRVAVQLHSAWRDKRYLAAVEQARRSLKQEERLALYGQAQRLLAEEVPLLPLSYSRLHLLVKPWVKRYLVSALGGVFWKDVVLEPH